MRRLLLDVRFCRYLFYGGNIIFCVSHFCLLPILFGIGSLCLGVWLYMEDSYSGLAPNSFSSMSAAGLCVCTGAMTFIISFIGCVSLYVQSKCFLISYFCFVCLLFIVQCVTGVMAYFYQEAVRQRVKFSLYSTIHRPFAVDYRNIRITWDHMQSQLRCCGVDNYTDWFYSSQWPNHRFVPDSCCDPAFFVDSHTDSLNNCGKSEANDSLFYTQGCYEMYSDWLLRHLLIVGLSAFFSILVESVLLYASLRLLCHFDKREKRRRNNGDEPTYRYSRNGGAVQDGECSLITSEGGGTATTPLSNGTSLR